MMMFVLGIMLIGFLSAAVGGFIKYKVFKEVFGGSFKKYAENKVLEQQFKMNRAKDAKEMKNEA